MNEHLFYKFYQKTPLERKNILTNLSHLSDEKKSNLLTGFNLPESVANQMIENQIGLYDLPLGIVPEVTVNGKTYTVPMVTEEPSVIAAASIGCKIIHRSGGFTTTQEKREMIGEIAIYDSPYSIEEIEKKLSKEIEYLFTIAHEAHPSIVKRGGGIQSIWVEEKQHPNHTFYVVYVSVDTKEAMGANILNTILEALVSPIETFTNGTCIMAILSNLATHSVVTTTCHIPFKQLETKTISGMEIAKRIEIASELSQVDAYRAATHNKGIMNGIDAVVIATGNDWRAIEAGAHAYASLSETYQPFSKWYIHDNKELVGTLSIPMPIGTVGGSIAIHPAAQFAHELLMNPSAKELAAIIASIGLAQNFAALKALVTDGIQKGHMNLQVKSLALTAGATEEEIPQIIQLLKEQKHLNLETVQKILESIR